MEKYPGQMTLAWIWEKFFGEEQAANFYRMHSMSNPGTLRSLVQEAGFQEINVKTAIGAMRFPTVEHCVRSYGAAGQIPGRRADAGSCDSRGGADGWQSPCLHSERGARRFSRSLFGAGGVPR